MSLILDTYPEKKYSITSFQTIPVHLQCRTLAQYNDKYSKSPPQGTHLRLMSLRKFDNVEKLNSKIWNLYNIRKGVIQKGAVFAFFSGCK